MTLVLPEGESSLDPKKPIGCSSLRRKLQLAELFPDADIKPVEATCRPGLPSWTGVNTAHSFWPMPDWKRLGLEKRVSRIFLRRRFFPLPVRNLAVRGRAGYQVPFLADFDDEEARLAALAERSFVRTLDGGCSSPVAAYAVIEGEEIRITGFLCR